MSKPVQMKRGDTVADVHPDEVENYTAAGFIPADEAPADDDSESEEVGDDELIDKLVAYFNDAELESIPKVGDTKEATGLDVNGKLIKAAWDIYTAEGDE